jgi:hypothetical protein
VRSNGRSLASFITEVEGMDGAEMAGLEEQISRSARDQSPHRE